MHGGQWDRTTLAFAAGELPDKRSLPVPTAVVLKDAGVDGIAAIRGPFAFAQPLQPLLIQVRRGAVRPRNIVPEAPHLGLLRSALG